jgi:hypothetical protein
MESRMDKIQRLGQEADAELRRQSAEAERAKVVQWLRAEAQLCDCNAYEEGECACGAWDSEPGERSYKRANIEDLADAIEARAHLGAEA